MHSTLFSFLPDICSFIPFPLFSFCFQSLFSATILPMIVPTSMNNKSNLESLFPFLCPKPQPCTCFPLCQAPCPSLSPSTRILLHLLAPRTFSIPCSIAASLPCCSQLHQSHPSSKSSQEHSAPWSFLLYLPAPKPLPALSCHLILLVELINLPPRPPWISHYPLVQHCLWPHFPFSQVWANTKRQKR